ncbi:MAG TPA: Sec-independent protein translocase protein TatB [Acetobacteraceae bacterium]|nr:Sec-independent protein translocase protein TatB [Acetobacteraceae bacterium]
MFDFAWSELGVIAVVALILIGPKDMPVAIKAVSRAIKKARGMAAEFQTHVDEMVREADLTEVRDQLSSLRGYNVTRALEKLVDDDGSIRRTFSENPLAGITTPAPARAAEGDVAVAERPAVEAQPAPPEPEPQPEPVMIAPEPIQRPDTPAFIPPSATPPAAGQAAPPEAPAFIPPEIARAPRPLHPG